MTHPLDRLHLSDFYLLFTWSCRLLVVTVLITSPLLHWCISCNCTFYSFPSSSLVSLVSPSIDVKQRDPYTWRDKITSVAVVHTVTVHCSCNYQWNEGNMWSLGQWPRKIRRKKKKEKFFNFITCLADVSTGLKVNGWRKIYKNRAQETK